jgi:hypothetical protein
VGDSLAGVELGKAFLDLGHENEAFDRVLDRGVGPWSASRIFSLVVAGDAMERSLPLGFRAA